MPFDGNLLGGLLLGVGMALSGACPGTLFVQAATGVPSGVLALAGAVAGGVVYKRWIAGLLERRREKKRTVEAHVEAEAEAERPRQKENKPQPPTFSTVLGIPTFISTPAFITLCAGIVVLTVVLGPKANRTSKIFGHDIPIPRPVLGGLLIGLSQLVSVLLRRGALLGVSAVFETVPSLGDHFWRHRDHYIGGREGKTAAVHTTETDALLASSEGNATPTTEWTPSRPPPPPPYGSVVFALGIAAGAYGLSRLAPSLLQPSSTTAGLIIVPPTLALLGGFAAALGARIAGGCTSGHGISGLGLLSVSSAVAIGAAFIGGGLVAPLFY